jgi:hypothetical protein
MQLIFGSGAHWVIGPAATPTPVRMGVAQNMGIDFTQATKSLYGINRMPVAVGAGELSIKGKSMLAQLTGRLYSDIMFGESLNTGQLLTSRDEVQAVPATSPYIILVTNSATWTRDLGVKYASGASIGIPLVRVSTSPIVGQYEVSGGTYTFAAADEGVSVKVSYNYTATGGDTVTLTNQPMGQAQNFSSVMALTYAGEQSTVTMNACVATKTSFATNISDFTKPDFEFECYADANDNLGTWSFAEAS